MFHDMYLKVKVTCSRTRGSSWRVSTSPRLRRQERRPSLTSLRPSVPRARQAGRGTLRGGRRDWLRPGSWNNSPREASSCVTEWVEFIVRSYPNPSTSPRHCTPSISPKTISPWATSPIRLPNRLRPTTPIRRSNLWQCRYNSS